MQNNSKKGLIARKFECYRQVVIPLYEAFGNTEVFIVESGAECRLGQEVENDLHKSLGHNYLVAEISVASVYLPEELHGIT